MVYPCLSQIQSYHGSFAGVLGGNLIDWGILMHLMGVRPDVTGVCFKLLMLTFCNDFVLSPSISDFLLLTSKYNL